MATKPTAPEAVEPAEDFSTSIGSSSDDEMDTALVPLDESGPPLAARVYVDVPQFRADEVALPRLRLAQGLTQEVSEGSAHPGNYVLLGHDAEEEVTFVPLKFNRHRELRTADNKVRCGSGDAEVGIGDPGGNCLACPMAKWQPSKTQADKNSPPPCKMGYSYVGYSLTHQTIVEFTVRSSNKRSQTAVQYVNTLIQNLGLGRFAVTLSAAKEQGPRGVYFSPLVQKTVVSPSDLELAREAIGTPVQVAAE